MPAPAPGLSAESAPMLAAAEPAPLQGSGNDLHTLAGQARLHAGQLRP